MTALSVNMNKIALLRNSRGRNYPNVIEYAQKFMDLGVQGITIHPRPDERHIRRQDAYDLAQLLGRNPSVELNIEGAPTKDFLKLISETLPQQCTLVPDGEEQLTSDHGWDVKKQKAFLTETIARLKELGVRAAVFLDPDPEQLPQVAETGADRIELYTEEYARYYTSAAADKVFEKYRNTALQAQQLGLGVNAGHDLDLQNLPHFLTIPGILEVSIGHALTVECIDLGMVKVIRKYLKICR